MLALFYFVIDAKGYSRWTLFFYVIEMNSILIYMAVKIVNFKSISTFFFSGAVLLLKQESPVLSF